MKALRRLIQFENESRVMNSHFPFTIRSIKCSIKVPKLFELEDIIQRCKQEKCELSTYPNFVVFSKLKSKKLPTDFNSNVKYTFFRYSKSTDLLKPSQHLNISGLTNFQHLKPCTEVLADLLNIDASSLHCIIDNLNATSKLPSRINKSKFVKIIPKVFQQFERFPAIFIRYSGIVILLYASGNCVFSGARSIDQLEKASSYLKSCYAIYLTSINS